MFPDRFWRNNVEVKYYEIEVVVYRKKKKKNYKNRLILVLYCSDRIDIQNRKYRATRFHTQLRKRYLR